MKALMTRTIAKSSTCSDGATSVPNKRMPKKTKTVHVVKKNCWASRQASKDANMLAFNFVQCLSSKKLQNNAQQFVIT